MISDYKKQLIKLPWEGTVGSKSNLNLFGKIVMFPFIVVFATTVSLCEILLTKDTGI